MNKLFLKTSLPPFAHLYFLSEVQSGNFHYFCFLFIIFSGNKSMGRILERFSSFPCLPAALALCSHLSGLLTSLTPAGKACGILLEAWLLHCLIPGLLLSLLPVNSLCLSACVVRSADLTAVTSDRCCKVQEVSHFRAMHLLLFPQRYSPVYKDRTVTVETG